MEREQQNGGATGHSPQYYGQAYEFGTWRTIPRGNGGTAPRPKPKRGG